jgi:hypothetical protein
MRAGGHTHIQVRYLRRLWSADSPLGCWGIPQLHRTRDGHEGRRWPARPLVSPPFAPSQLAAPPTPVCLQCDRWDRLLQLHRVTIAHRLPGR